LFIELIQLITEKLLLKSDSSLLNSGITFMETKLLTYWTYLIT